MTLKVRFYFLWVSILIYGQKPTHLDSPMKKPHHRIEDFFQDFSLFFLFFLCSAWKTETVRMPGVLASICPKTPPFETHFSSSCQSQTLWLSTVWPELFAAAPPRRPHYVSTSAPHSRRGWWNQGTIHILRKHLYSTKLNLTFKFFTKKIGFFHQNKIISVSTLHFDEIFLL